MISGITVDLTINNKYKRDAYIQITPSTSPLFALRCESPCREAFLFHQFHFNKQRWTSIILLLRASSMYKYEKLCIYVTKVDKVKNTSLIFIFFKKRHNRAKNFSIFTAL